MLPSELLAKPEAWTRFKFARDKNHWNVSTLSPEACSWCLVGALKRCGQHNIETHKILRDKIIELWPHEGIYSTLLAQSFLHNWNDNPSTKHEDVLTVLKGCNL
jgi:hypothetical protein